MITMAEGSCDGINGTARSSSWRITHTEGHFGNRVLFLIVSQSPNVWTRESLDQLMLNIPGTSTLVVSRSKFAGTRTTYDVELLNKDEAMSVFCLSAFNQKSVPSGFSKSLVQQVVGECKGLPFSLKVVGASLKNQSEKYWEGAVTRLSKSEPADETHDSRVFAQIESSLENLDLKTRDCFLELGAFPEDKKIPLDAFINVLVELHDLEDTSAFVVVVDLANRNLLTLVKDPSRRGLRQGCSLSPYLFVICMNVLSCMLDKAAKAKQFDFHPKCKLLNLTHLCFADDHMVFADGTKRSVQGVLEVFDDFATHSGLQISLEKSTLFMAGISQSETAEILQQFPFTFGELPVRYLGLPLLPKRMSVADYLPLLEKICSQISSWTARTLSFVGRLQLLSSVTFSLTNFWIAAFRLPKACIREIDKLCSAFLWSGPSLKPNKAKVAWNEACLPKKEGGLGLRSIEEANKVSILKLIWRVLSAHDSLWVDWVKKYLIRSGSLWSENLVSSVGSWIWNKILKYRTLASQFHRVEVKNGESTSFWFDQWCPMGCLHDTFGDRGLISLGIPKTSTVADVMVMTRQRRHRQPLLNQVEEEIQKQTLIRIAERDIALRKKKDGVYCRGFKTKETCSLIRTAKPDISHYKAIWFPYSTPRYAFISWLVQKDRLSTGDRMQKWSSTANPSYIFCNHTIETTDHLFFQCSFSGKVWEQLAKGLLLNKYTANWRDIVALVDGTELDKTKRFLIAYTYQNTLHSIWRERNARRHGDHSSTVEKLVQLIDKNVRNRLSTIGNGVADTIQTWFAARLY